MLRDLQRVASGKVRDIYAVGDDLLLVASDRISTYDVVHPTPIPDKGKVLTGLSAFWFDLVSDLVDHHVLGYVDGVPEEVRGRAVRVKRLNMLPVECVVRGYLSGSGWTDYQETGSVAGIRLPDGLTESARLEGPIFTPATKAQGDAHDATVSMDAAAALIGDKALVERVRDLSLAIYARVADHCKSVGVLLADTKLEFGVDPEDGTLVLADEVCTPDSSRFWPADQYAPGGPQASYDKQFVRDWALGTGWDRTPPAPAIPDEVVQKTHDLYLHAYERLTGDPFSDWIERTAG